MEKVYTDIYIYNTQRDHQPYIYIYASQDDDGYLEKWPLTGTVAIASFLPPYSKSWIAETIRPLHSTH